MTLLQYRLVVFFNGLSNSTNFSVELLRLQRVLCPIFKIFWVNWRIDFEDFAYLNELIKHMPFQNVAIIKKRKLKEMSDYWLNFLSFFLMKNFFPRKKWWWITLFTKASYTLRTKRMFSIQKIFSVCYHYIRGHLMSVQRWIMNQFHRLYS